MTQSEKDFILTKAREHVEFIKKRIDETQEYTRNAVTRMLQEAKSMSRADQMSTEGVAKNFYDRIPQLQHLSGSPYFVRCDIRKDDGSFVTYYFSKFQFSEESIYSWIAPAATLRFEKPGPATYGRSEEKKYVCTLLRKDNYMIVDSVITFLSTESQVVPRELVYQKDFTSRKTGFILPEIVEQMEKAQDQIIRADHRGSFVVSGPAGSGKTTLALHRIAYLILSPDTAHLYAHSRMIVFVQDKGSKEYFSHLLPELGIQDVVVTTFAEWAFEVLGITDHTFVQKYGSKANESDFLEYEKIQALNVRIPPFSNSFYKVLDVCYAQSLSSKSLKIVSKQKKEKVFDRADLIVLLQAFYEKNGSISLEQEYYVKQKNGVLKKKTGRLPVKYSLILVDEFQNYMPQQLKVFQSCLSVRDQGLLYVGDSAQQIYFGTLKDFSQIEEVVPPERYVTLAKVYRNTKKILVYIQSLGYVVTIPEQMREGNDVSEVLCDTLKDEIEYIHEIRKKYQQKTIGILAYERAYLTPFIHAFLEQQNVYVKTMNEAQGLEFDSVCIVGIQPDMFSNNFQEELPLEFLSEQKRIRKDLVYVALTRAIDELHVLGTIPLKELTIFKEDKES